MSTQSFAANTASDIAPSQDGPDPTTTPTVEEIRAARAQFFKTFRELQIIAQRVGGNFGMEVRIGKAGEGSFFNPIDKSITFDPLHIIEDPEFAKFVASHEGAHKAIMLDPEKLGLTPEQVKTLYSQMGFGFGQNITEDGAGNDWKDKSYIGLEPGTRAVYEKQFADKDAVLSTPEVTDIARRLGRWPLFARYGSELLRDWNELRKIHGIERDLPLDEPGHFSPTTPAVVLESLERSIRAARKCMSTIPPPGCRSKPLIKQAHQERFKINTEEIYPEIRKLAQLDLGIETGRQAYNEFMQKLDKLGKLEKDLNQAKASNDKTAQNDLQRQIDKLNEELTPYNSMPKSARQEIENQVREAIKQQVRDFADKIQKAARELGKSRVNQKNLQETLDELEQSGNKNKTASEALNDLKESLAMEKAKENATRKKIDNILDKNLGDTPSGKKLSDEIKKAIDEATDPNREQKPSASSEQKESGMQDLNPPKQPGKQQGQEQKGESGQSGESQSSGDEQGAETGGEQGGQSSGGQSSGQGMPGGSNPGSGSMPGQFGEEMLDKLENQVSKDRLENGELPLPFDKFSPETQQSVEEMVGNLPDEQFEKCKEKAESELKEFEQAANKEIEGKLNENPTPSSGNQKGGQKGGEDGEAGDSKDTQQGKPPSGTSSPQGGSGSSQTDVSGLDVIGPIDFRSRDPNESTKPSKRKEPDEKHESSPVEKLKKTRKSVRRLMNAKSQDSTEFEAAEKEIEVPLENLKKAFRRILRPTKDQALTSGHAEGRVNMHKAMRLEREPHLVNELFDRWTDPVEINHAFGTLIDRSTSMASGPAWEAYKGAVLQAKLLDWERLKVPNAAWVFSDDYLLIKDFNEKITNSEVRDRFGSILRVTGGTNDARAIWAMYQDLLTRPEKFKFLPVITDAGTGMADELRAVIDAIKAEKKVIVVHFGLGPGTADSNGIYPYSFGNLSVSDTKGARSFSAIYKTFIKTALRYPKRFFEYQDTAAIIDAIEKAALKS